ncbi:hypothetical protein HDU99_003796 [Rhizoclosmatium hyalinum]|nr:hypothetical protein HDU99_003796 [Rhizoclosmatium hyalinum]
MQSLSLLLVTAISVFVSGVAASNPTPIPLNVTYPDTAPDPVAEGPQYSMVNAPISDKVLNEMISFGLTADQVLNAIASNSLTYSGSGTSFGVAGAASPNASSSADSIAFLIDYSEYSVSAVGGIFNFKVYDKNYIIGDSILSIQNNDGTGPAGVFFHVYEAKQLWYQIEFTGFIPDGLLHVDILIGASLVPFASFDLSVQFFSPSFQLYFYSISVPYTPPTPSTTTVATTTVTSTQAASTISTFSSVSTVSTISTGNATTTVSSVSSMSTASTVFASSASVFSTNTDIASNSISIINSVDKTSTSTIATTASSTNTNMSSIAVTSTVVMTTSTVLQNSVSIITATKAAVAITSSIAVAPTATNAANVAYVPPPTYGPPQASNKPANLYSSADKVTLCLVSAMCAFIFFA